jgi:hypothetical protein
MPVDGGKWLFDVIGSDAQITDRFMEPGSRSGINRKEVWQYMDRVVEFREALTVLS